jgi:hypothetical protein
MADEEDPKTESELRKVRAEAKQRRLENQELQELIDTQRGQLTKLEKDNLTLKAQYEAAVAEHTTFKTDAEKRLKEAADATAAKVAEVTAAKDGEIATLRTGFETQQVSAEVRMEAIRQGVRNPDDFVKLVDLTKISRDTDGKLVGVADLVGAEKKGERAYLFGDGTSTTKPGVTPPNPQDPGQRKSATTMTDDEFKAGLKEFGVKNVTFAAP